MRTSLIFPAVCLLSAFLLAACGQPQAPGPASVPGAEEEARFQLAREQMVERDIEDRGVTDPLVLAAMGAVPRHLLVPDEYRGAAYANTPLPIGEGQTISQPYMVALMSELLKVKPGKKILEVGTGSGYQAAILAQMGAQVYSIEIIPILAERARQSLDELGYRDVRTRVADGYFGWEDQAPFDGIIVTAAPDHVPPPLLAQLKPTGVMVIPVGPPGAVQTLWLIERREGEWVSLNKGRVIFVPLLQE
jgi:protein-L-isoaspartate(D-aspartate) O-methyltransferase